MRKKRVYPKREVKEDIFYHSITVSKFINFLMKDGEKSIAKNILYQSLDMISSGQKVSKENTPRLLENIISNVACEVEIRGMKFGGAVYRVPTPSSEFRQKSKAIRTIVDISRKHSRKDGVPMHQSLYNEFRNILSNTGDSIKKKEQTLKTAAANKAFAHFLRRKRR